MVARAALAKGRTALNSKGCAVGDTKVSCPEDAGGTGEGLSPDRQVAETSPQ